VRTIIVVRSVVVILGVPGLVPARRFPPPSLAIGGGLALALVALLHSLDPGRGIHRGQL
jgi:protein-S-isoprenylcysteine O-methyltransferase Ste14